MAAEARALTLSIQSAVQKRWPSTVRLWPTPNWPLTLPDGRRVRPPRTGQSDLMGVAAPTGRLIAVEVKTAHDRLSPDQLSFAAMIRAFGGVFIEGRSPEQVVSELEAALMQASFSEAQQR